VTKVLFHSYHYPPIGGSGAQRPLKMSRYLSELGYDLIVITGSGARVDRWAPKDETLASEIPPELVVRRVAAASEPETATRWEDRAERWLWMTSSWVRWWVDESAKLGVDAGAEADLIYVWMQPYASAAAGVTLSRKLGKPWVADLGDPWALDEMMVYPTRIHHRRELQRMEEMLSTASAIVMSTDEAVRRLLDRFPQFASKRVVAIPNGYDAADFDRPVQYRRGETFRIVQTGYLHTQLGREHRRLLPLRRVLGGSTQGLDIRTRSHVYVVEAINQLLARDPTLVGSLDFEIAGVLTEADREVAARCRVSRLHGYVTHAESIDLIRTADLLFLPMQNLPPGVRATIVPGKTYEYLASGTPILAAVPDGDARDILQAAGNARLCRPDNVDGMAAAIWEAVSDFRAGRPAARPDPDVVARFEYRTLADRLASVFEEVVGSASRAAVV
jgi:glycosyltransferase involved in cell wall biosynthesis